MDHLSLTWENFEVYRRHLPHWRADHVVYHIDWRLRAGTPPLQPDERTIVATAIEHFHAKRYWLLAYVVMDDHVHVVVRLPREQTLGAAVHSWKSFTANRLQRQANRFGAIWQQEYYDHIVRDAEELQNALQYIANNPIERWPELKEYQWQRFFEP